MFKRISYTLLFFLPQLKRGLGLAFVAHFLHDFSVITSIPRNQKNVLLSSYLDN